MWPDSELFRFYYQLHKYLCYMHASLQKFLNVYLQGRVHIIHDISHNHSVKYWKMRLIGNINISIFFHCILDWHTIIGGGGGCLKLDLDAFFLDPFVMVTSIVFYTMWWHTQANRPWCVILFIYTFSLNIIAYMYTHMLDYGIHNWF